MTPSDPYEIGVPRTTDTLHIAPLGAGPSLLIRGSDAYEDCDRRSLCGSISAFEPAEETHDTRDYCFSCVRIAYLRGIINNPAPFSTSEIERGERDRSQLRAGGGPQ